MKTLQIRLVEIFLLLPPESSLNGYGRLPIFCNSSLTKEEFYFSLNFLCCCIVNLRNKRGFNNSIGDLIARMNNLNFWLKIGLFPGSERVKEGVLHNLYKLFILTSKYYSSRFKMFHISPSSLSLVLRR